MHNDYTRASVRNQRRRRPQRPIALFADEQLSAQSTRSGHIPNTSSLDDLDRQIEKLSRFVEESADLNPMSPERQREWDAARETLHGTLIRERETLRKLAFFRASQAVISAGLTDAYARIVIPLAEVALLGGPGLAGEAVYSAALPTSISAARWLARKGGRL